MGAVAACFASVHIVQCPRFTRIYANLMNQFSPNTITASADMQTSQPVHAITSHPPLFCPALSQQQHCRVAQTLYEQVQAGSFLLEMERRERVYN
jgi:hypothetical protein